MKGIHAGVVLGLVCSLAACNSNDDAQPAAVSAVAAPYILPVVPEISWHPCKKDKAECGTAKVPLRWSEPDSEQITIGFRRIKMKGAVADLWLLQGGPGLSGAAMVGLGAALAKEGLQMDLYIPDHRGTGMSTRLSCSALDDFQMAGGEWDECIDEIQSKWSEGLAGFSTHDAAVDVGALITATRTPDRPVALSGGSYGSYWGHRYLTMFPGQVDRVLLDSLCLAQGGNLGRWDVDHDAITRRILLRCGQDEFCAGQLGAHPLERARQLQDSLDADHCPGLQEVGLDRQGLRRILGAVSSHTFTIPLVPLLIHRLGRCSEHDIDALTPIGSILKDFPEYDEAEPLGGLDSLLLHRHVVMSELSDVNVPSVEDALAHVENLLAATEPGVHISWLSDRWPRYARDPRAGQRSTSNAPTLLLQGGLDARTTLASAEPFLHLLGGGAPGLVVAPDVGHSVMGTAVTSLGRRCMIEAAADWLMEPGAELPGTCLEDLAPLDFAKGAMEAGGVLGMKDDPWGDEGLRFDPRQTTGGRDLLERIRRVMRPDTAWR